MVCPHCGKQVEDFATFCPECGADLMPPPETNTAAQESTEAPKSEEKKNKTKLDPLTLVGAVFSSIAFLFGFVLITCALAKGVFATFDMIVVFPALIGLGIGAYRFFGKKIDKLNTLVSLGCMLLSATILTYAFLEWFIIIV